MDMCLLEGFQNSNLCKASGTAASGIGSGTLSVNPNGRLFILYWTDKVLVVCANDIEMRKGNIPKIIFLKLIMYVKKCIMPVNCKFIYRQ